MVSYAHISEGSLTVVVLSLFGWGVQQGSHMHLCSDQLQTGIKRYW